MTGLGLNGETGIGDHRVGFGKRVPLRGQVASNEK